MQCPAEAYQKIMGRKKRNKAKIKNHTKTERACCEEEKRENLDELSIIIKGKWDTIQKAIGDEYSAIAEKGYKKRQ